MFLSPKKWQLDPSPTQPPQGSPQPHGLNSQHLPEVGGSLRVAGALSPGQVVRRAGAAERGRGRCGAHWAQRCGRWTGGGGTDAERNDGGWVNSVFYDLCIPMFHYANFG